ncbi:DUF1367 family protein [Rhodoferax mekongensis]|uniref:DUF1367 family protein n=1 Tax=Rhodoferax mekongensis TaxID=3068341 RepID=A0ABZ0B540_9BURK|nr:DUF1367 family protein [Rhodoferax sp. TBRC 17307]WNO05987.1 DUF1367 family protein [Rhodoferax sp. TBRC 17307]
MMKAPGGALIPFDDDQADKVRKFKPGAVIRADFKEMRNGSYFRKWWTLVDYAFDLWSDGIDLMQYEGRDVLPNKERFRKELTIMAGYFHPVYSIDGSFTLEADSLQWSKMSEETFDKLYQATITAVLSKVLAHKNISREELDRAVDNLLRFA